MMQRLILTVWFGMRAQMSARIMWDTLQTNANSFDCEGTYIYAPLVGLTFGCHIPQIR